MRQAPRDAAAAGKFGPRAKRGRLIGYGQSGVYEQGQLRHALGYVIAGADNSITVSRHVLFDEAALFDPIVSGDIEPHVNSDTTGSRDVFPTDSQLEIDRDQQPTQRGGAEDPDDDLAAYDDDDDADDADDANDADDDVEEAPRHPTDVNDDDDDDKDDDLPQPMLRPTGLLRVGLRQQTQPSYNAGVVVLAADVPTPVNFRDAMAGPQHNEWSIAIIAELSAHAQLRTFDEVIVAAKTPIIPTKFVYKVKPNPDGSVDRYKARLVAQGFRQIPGRHFDEDALYSPTLRYDALRLLLAHAAFMHKPGDPRWQVSSADVTSAYLNAEVPESEQLHLGLQPLYQTTLKAPPGSKIAL